MCLSGPRLEKPSAVVSVKSRKREYQNNTDKIEANQIFSLSKWCYGM